MSAISFPRNSQSKLHSQLLQPGLHNQAGEHYLMTEGQYDTQEKKNSLLIRMLSVNLRYKSPKDVKEFCINELKAISCIIEASGSEDYARINLNRFYADHDNQNLTKQNQSHINDLINLFKNRNTGYFGQQNINRVAAKYIETLKQVLNNDLSHFSNQELQNLNKVAQESSKWYRGNYIQNIKVTECEDKFIVQLGRKGGTMGLENTLDLAKLDIKIIPTIEDKNHIGTSNNSQTTVNEVKPKTLEEALAQTEHTDYIKERILFDYNHQSTSLELEGCGLNEIPNQNILSFFPFLKVLNLAKNNISKVPEDIFISLVNLETLWLDHNQIRELPENAFNGLINLKKLDLSYNQIRHKHENAFNSLANLEILNLNYNLLSSLEPNFFINLSKIKSINLTFNQIKQISQDVFSNLEELFEVKMIDNQIELPRPANSPKSLFSRILANDSLRAYITLSNQHNAVLQVIPKCILEYYIRYSANRDEATSISEEYCLKLLVNNQLMEPEAISLLTDRIYFGNFDLNQINKKLGWYCKLFIKRGLSLLPFLLRYYTCWGEQEIIDSINSYQLVTAPNRTFIEEKAKAELLAKLRSVKPEINDNDFNPDLILAQMLPLLKYGIDNLVGEQIKLEITRIFQKLEIEDKLSNINYLESLLQIILVIADNQKEQIRNFIAQQDNLDEEIRKLLVDNLCGIDPIKIEQNTIYESLAQIGIPESLNTQVYEVFNAYYPWDKAVNKIKDNELQELSVFVRNSRAAFIHNKAIYSQYILNILPYLSFRDILACIDDNITESCKDKLSLVISYCNICGYNEADESVLGLLVANRNDGIVLLGIKDLLDLNPLNGVIFGVDSFRLISIDNTTFRSENLTKHNLEQIEVPLYFRELIKRNFSAANIVASVVFEAIIKNSEDNGFTLTSAQKQQLERICYLSAQKPAQDVFVPLEFKRNLRESFRDESLLNGELGGKPAGEFNQLMLYLSGELEKIADDKQKIRQFPQLVIEKMKKLDFYNGSNELIDELLKSMAKLGTSQNNITRYEVAYLLGMFFINLSSIYVLGYHDEITRVNTSFNYFRLKGGLLLALSIIDETNNWSEQEKQTVCRELRQILLDNECAGQLINKLMGNGAELSNIHERIKAILNIKINE